MTCLTECLAAQLEAEATKLRAAVFYPSGKGLLDTGLWTSDRNRPADLANERPRSTPAMTVADLQAKGIPIQPLGELADMVVEGIRDGRFVMVLDRDRHAATLPPAGRAVRRGERHRGPPARRLTRGTRDARCGQLRPVRPGHRREPAPDLAAAPRRGPALPQREAGLLRPQPLRRRAAGADRLAHVLVGPRTVLELIDPLAPEPDGVTDGQMMIFSDPPYHDTLRAWSAAASRPGVRVDGGAGAACAARPRQVAGAGSSGFDYLGDFAGQIPAMVIGELLGIPEDDQRPLGHWTDQFMHYDPDLDPPGEVLGVKQLGYRARRAWKNLIGYLEADHRRPHLSPADDMISRSCRRGPATGGGTRKLSRPELSSFVMLLFTAGAETTARLLGWTAVMLARHPEQRAKLVGDRSLLPGRSRSCCATSRPPPSRPGG